MKLTDWAKKQGVCYQTAWNLYTKGLIPGAKRIGNRTIIVIEPEVTPSAKEEHVVCYARVSSSQQTNNLDSQASRLVGFCAAKGYIVNSVVKETGSGLNDKRPKLVHLLENTNITKIVVEHHDRLTRFGFNYLKLLLAQRGCSIEVINESTNDRDDLMKDFISLVTSFCSRLYGLRGTKRKTEEIIKVLENENNQII